MSTTTISSQQSQAAPDDAAQDVFQQISELALQSRTPKTFYFELLELLRTHFGARFAAINLCNPAEGLDESVVRGESAQPVWQKLAQAVMLESQADGAALAKIYQVDEASTRAALLVVPLRDQQQYRGALALVADCADRKDAESLLFELRTLTSLACTLVSAMRETCQQSWTGPDAVQRALSRASRFESLTELAFAITNGLKTKFQCDQVVLGKVDRGRVTVLSLSGMDGLYPRSPGTRLIRQAMEECVDCGRIIGSRPGNEWSESRAGRDYRLHRQWRAAIGGGAVASVPLMVDDTCVAVISVVWSASAGIGMEQLDEIASLAGAYAPAIQLVDRASRGWLAQTRDSLRSGLLWLVERNRWGRRLTAAALVALAIWFCFGSLDYQLTTPCRLLPTRMHHCVSPYEGTIESCRVEVGDRVESGEVLFAMETSDLELRQAELQSQAAVRKLELAQAVAAGQFESAAMARAQLQVTLARLAGVQRRIEKSRVRAPIAGIIMSGDVQRRVGEVVELGEPLLELAPGDSWTVELQVSSRDAQVVSAGQTGHFATLARPDQRLRCRVTHVEPTATVEDGETYYVARAVVTGKSAESLAGMDGVATLAVGKRPVWWVALHRAIDFVRLHFWV